MATIKGVMTDASKLLIKMSISTMNFSFPPIRQKPTLARTGLFHLRIAILFLLPAIAWPEDHNQILQKITPGSIVFIGENHQRPESPLLVKQLVEQSIAKNQCPIIGFEIDSSEQAIIDKAINNIELVSKIKIPVVIDHPPMRKLIAELLALKASHPCLKIIAIDDTSIESKQDRDEWMAKKISELPKDKDRPILVLLGSLHTLKKIDWLVPSGKPSVAEILDKRGFQVKSFPQRWIPDKCPKNNGRKGRFIDADNPEALAILNRTLISLINAKPHNSTSGVIDGFLIWECT